MTVELITIDSGTELQVLDHGFVRLDDYMADDLSVVNSAKVSFGRRANSMNESGAVGLIKYLMKNRHGTPFEHNSFRFHVKAPIFIFREWQRHRIGSFNELSARYTELPGEWYIPRPENVRTRVGKPGHYSYEPLEHELALRYMDALEQTCADSYDEYIAWMNVGVAPEQARLFLHVNHYSEMYWTVNARSMMNFLNLRNAPTAQWEIQQYAAHIALFLHVIMPVTYEAFIENGFVAP